MTVEIAKSSDIDQILELRKMVCSMEYMDYSNLGTVRQTGPNKNSEDDLNTELLIKAEEQSEIVGCISVCKKDNTCYIGQLIIRSDYRGRGVGLRLLSKVEKIHVGVKKYEIVVDYSDYENLYICCLLGYYIDTVKTNKCKDGLVYMEKGKK